MVTFDINFETRYEKVRNPWAEFSADADEFYLREKPDNQASAPGTSHDDRATIPPAKRDEILSRDNHMCQNCGSDSRQDETYLEVHHVVPSSLGGTNRGTNLLTLCRECHKAAHGWE